jgi:hypothetical protein
MRALLVKALMLLGLGCVFMVSWSCDDELFDPEVSPICDLQPSADIEFGSVALGAYRDTMLTFRNLNEVDDAQNYFRMGAIPDGDCGVFTIPTGGLYAGVRLNAAGELTVPVRFQPDAAQSYECRLQMWYHKYQDYLIGTQNLDIARPCAAQLTWTGSGIVSPMFSVEPSEIAGGTVLVGELGGKGIRITNRMDREIGGTEPALPVDGFKRRSDATCPSAFRVEPSTAVIPMGESREFTVHFDPTEPGDWFCEFDLVLGDAADSYTHFFTPPPGPHLTVTATSVAPACGLEPGAELDYGQVVVGSSSVLTLTIRNETADPIAGNQFKYILDNPTTDCRVFTIDPADTAYVIGAGEPKEIPVRFAPDAGGAFECTRSLASLKEPADPADPNLTLACPTSVVWRGEGVGGSVPVWSSCAPGGSNDWYGVSGVSGSLIYVAGDGGSVIASVGDCQWPASGTVFADVDLKDIWAYSDGADTAAWAVGNIPPPPGTYGETGAILRMDGGIWQKADEGWIVTYGAVWGSALDDVYFVGTGVSTDFPNAKHWDGSAFDTLSIDLGMSELTGVSGNAANDIWAVLRQQSYSVYHYDGSQWTNETQQWMNKPLHDVWTVAGSGYYQVYAVGEDGAIYHFDGTHWTDESIAGETRDFYGVWVSPTGQVFVVGEGQVIYHFDGNAWNLETPPPGLPAGDLRDVWGAADDDVYAVGSGGVILRYAPGGG